MVKKSSPAPFPAHIAALYSRPQDQWGVREWRTLATWLIQERERALDGWGEAIAQRKTYEKLTSELLELLREKHRQDQFIASVEAKIRELAQQKPTKSKGSRGRPKTRDWQEGLAAWDSERERVLTPDERKLSEKKQIELYFKRERASQGLKTISFDGPKFQASSKTMRNLLASARRPAKGRPEK